MNCTEILRDSRQPRFRVEVKAHIVFCSQCRDQITPYFNQLHKELETSENMFVDASAKFDELICKHACRLMNSNMADVSRHIAQTMCRQVHSEYERYFSESPDSTVAALCWLQKVFVLCRIFSSEELIDKAAGRKVKPLHVGNMPVPLQTSIFVDTAFAKVTSLLHFPEAVEHYGIPIFNPELQKLIETDVNDGKYVQALTLICDSPKHGVLSLLINLAATTHPEWVYRLGLSAAALAIEKYVKEKMTKTD